MKNILIITNCTSNASNEIKKELFKASKKKNCNVITIPVETDLKSLNINSIFKAEITSDKKFLEVIKKISYPLFEEIKEVLEIYA